MLKDIQSTGKKDTRSGFGDGIVEAARSKIQILLRLQLTWQAP